MPHPVRLMGLAIASGDRLLHTGSPRADMVRGALLAISVIAASLLLTWLVIAIAQAVSPYAAAIVGMLIGWTALSARGLDDAAREVAHALARDDLATARRAIRALVGRDPESLDHDGLIRGTIESLAENLSDGFVAPLFFLVLVGPAGAMAYKAINTLDSMIGYRSERYLFFGRCAARLDDVANLIPARIAAMAIAAASALVTGRAKQSLRTILADAHKHDSPNAGYPEAAMAGALGIRLGGDAYYGGELEHRAQFGTAERAPDLATLNSARSLMWTAAALSLVVVLSLRMVWTIS
jgi:adenosylcobinamide-phosphate synthase